MHLKLIHLIKEVKKEDWRGDDDDDDEEGGGYHKTVNCSNQ